MLSCTLSSYLSPAAISLFVRVIELRDSLADDDNEKKIPRHIVTIVDVQKFSQERKMMAGNTKDVCYVASVEVQLHGFH